jgi:RNA polymerase sigma-70 factor (ECF subfamily)
MTVDRSEDESKARTAAQFAATHWSVVLAARAGEDTQATLALETLCRAYWFPLYAYVRRLGNSPEDSQDLTQGFFARLIEKDYLSAVHPAKGRFRSFLLTALKRYVADEYDKASAGKRGSGRPLISLDGPNVEDRYRLDPGVELTPERLFDRRWAITLLERSRARLKDEYVAAGKGDLFERLKSFYHQDEAAIAYAEAAAQMSLPENTVKSHVRRLRGRYRQIVREEIAQTVSDEAEVDDEIRYLLEVISR